MKAGTKASPKPKPSRKRSTSKNDPSSMETFIHENQTILSAAEEVAKMGSWKWDLRTQKVTWSDEMFRLFGVEREGFDGDINRVVAERIHPDDIAAVNDSNRRVVEDAIPIPMSYRIVLPDGQERTVWAQGRLERDKTGRPIALIGFVQDITERVRAEKKVLQMKRLYATLSQVNQMIVRVKERDELYQTICDVAVKYGEFSIAWVSLLDEESGDMRPVAATGVDILDWPFPILNIRQGSYQNALVPIAIRTSKVTTSENALSDSRTQYFRHKYDTYKINAVAAIPFRLREKTIGIVGLISRDTGIFNDEDEIKLLEEMGFDISFALENMENEKERKQAEELIHQSEAQFRHLVEHLHAGVVIHAPDTSIVFNNPQASRILHLSSEQMRGKVALDPAWTFIREDQTVMPLNEYPVQQVVASGKPLENLVMGIKFSDQQEPAWGLINAYPEFDASGKLLQVVVTFVEITERKKAEYALTHSHDLMRYIIEHNRSAVAVHDRDMKYIYVSQRYLDDYKIDEDVIGRHHYEVFPDLPQKWRDVHQRVLQGEVLSAEDDRFERADGSVEWTRWECRPWFEADGSIGGLIVYTEIVTDRIKAEEALLRNEHVLRLFVEHSPASIAMFDREMKYIVASHRFLVDYDLPPQDLTGRSHYDVFPEIPERWKEIHRRCLQGNTEMAEEDLFPRANGKVDWVRWEIRPWYEEPEKIGGIILFSEVITDRKQAREALQQSEERHRLISSLISDYVYSGSTLPDGTTQTEWVSGAFEQITGYSLEEVNQLPHGFASLILPEDLAVVMEHQVPQLAGGSAPLQYRIRRKDGEIRWLLDYVQYLSGSEQKTQLLGAVQDITPRKQAEEALYKLNAELEQRVLKRTLELSQANRAKDEFLANMSHELRTPLNTVLGLSESLLEQRNGVLTEKQAQSLQLISSSGRHLLSLINDILEVSKVEAGKLELHPAATSVKELCESSLNFIKQMALVKQISLQFRNEHAVTQVYADPQRVKQILINLLMNAVKFTPEHGQVTLDVRTNKEQDQIMFSVTDTGIGIKEDDLKKLFTPFTQLDSSLSRQYTGTGLGLVLVHKLTDLHGGSVHVESKEGQGSCFTIVLPLPRELHQPTASDSAAVLPDLTDSVARAPSVHGSILLAEDNEINASMLSEYLTTHGYNVVIAQDGEEALQIAEKVEPGIILMDIQMPRLDGLEAIRRLRANPRFASTPIIAITALAMPGDKERCFEAGANEYMSKPVTLRNVSKLIKKLMEQAE